MPDSLKANWIHLQDLMSELHASFKYWIDWYEARLQGEPLEWEKIRDQILLPKEILSQDPAAINAYLIKLSPYQAVRPLNRVRVILIGPGESGKTSLLRALHGEQVIEGREDKTVGIEIRLVGEFHSCAPKSKLRPQGCLKAALEKSSGIVQM
jgi:hypothetical protein